MIRLLGFVLVVCSAAPGFAQDTPCAPNGDTFVPVFAAAKLAMLTGDYDRFYDMVTPFVADADARKEELIGPLQSVLPEGFASCWTVVQRFEEPGFYQEVTFFDSGSGPVGLYLQGVYYDGDIRIMHFAYSDVPSDMLEKLQ